MDEQFSGNVVMFVTVEYVCTLHTIQTTRHAP